MAYRGARPPSLSTAAHSFMRKKCQSFSVDVSSSTMLLLSSEILQMMNFGLVASGPDRSSLNADMHSSETGILTHVS